MASISGQRLLNINIPVPAGWRISFEGLEVWYLEDHIFEDDPLDDEEGTADGWCLKVGPVDDPLVDGWYFDPEEPLEDGFWWLILLDLCLIIIIKF